MDNKAKISSVVYETPSIIDRPLINIYLNQNIPVWIVEPFHAYHHNKGLRFYPPHFPLFAENLIKSGRISVIKADDIEAKNIYGLAADKAVDIVESVYPYYRDEREDLINHVADTLKSPFAENVFKNKLCNSLAEFYSANILLHRIEEYLDSEITIYPNINIHSYCAIKKLLLKAGHEFYHHPHVHFLKRSYIASAFENIKVNLVDIAQLCAQTVASGLSAIRKKSDMPGKKSFKYGVSIVSPRQLANNRRGPGFIIDNKKIHESDVIYLLQINLSNKEGNALGAMPCNVFMLPQPKRFFSNAHEWRKLLRIAIRQNLMNFCREVHSANVSFFNYFRWKKVLEQVRIEQFITHCDFGISHISRNIALNQAGVRTWYFTDSMNHFNNFQRDESVFSMRHPFWTYLCYDNFVTWSSFLADYFKTHPGSFKKTHVVGCLWSEHITDKPEKEPLKEKISGKHKKNKFIIAVYDTTYTRNGITSYLEGIAFAEHILRLVNEIDSIHILMKEKKSRDIHGIMDPINGPRLVDLYNSMNKHPDISFYSDQDDSSLLMSFAEVVISFPFTSTTFEALSVNKPAIWHDPMGLYTDTPYAKVKGVTTHGYEELKKRILEIKELQGEYQNPIPKDSPLIDPFRDGKAIERFRDLLISN